MKRKANIPDNAAVALMDPVELYRAANYRLAGAGATMADVASTAGTNTARVYAYQDGDAETLGRVLSIVGAQARMGQPLVLQRLARDAGYLLVPLPGVPRDGDEEAIEAIATTMEETARAVRTFAAAVADGEVTPKEYAEYQRCKTAAEEALERLGLLAYMATEEGRRQRARKAGGGR